MKPSQLKLMMVALVFGVGGCDCQDRVRSLLYGDEEPRIAESAEKEQAASKLREIEPNDSAQDATPISLRGEMRPMRGAIDPVGDVDWFVMEVSGDEDWVVELNVVPEDSNLDVAVYLEVPGDGGEAPLMYDVAGPGETESVPMLSVPAGEQRRFFVTGVDDSEGEYRIDARRRLSAASVAMAPNDHPHLAMTLQVPGEIQGFYDRPHDRDIFYVPAESLQAGTYSLELSSVPDLSQTLRIYGDDSLESALMQISVTGQEPAIIPNLSLGAEAGGGLYFVLTAGESYSRERGYRLRLIEHPPAVGYVIEREPNNTASSAQTISFGDVIRGYLHTEDDVDRFRFVIEDSRLEEEDEEEPVDDEEAVRRAQQEFDPIQEEEVEEDEPEFFDPWEAVPEKEQHEYIVQSRLRPLGDAHRLAMRWLPGEESGEREEEFRADDSEQELVICNKVLGPGAYDIEVRALDTDEGFRARSFDYELEVMNIAEKPGLEIEPNTTPQQADRLVLGESRVGFISTAGDVDVFAFIVGPDELVELGVEEEDEDAQEGEEVAAVDAVAPSPWEAPETEEVRIHLEGNQLNLGFEILDDEGGRVANVNRSGPGSDEELNIDLPQGLYYVAVSAASGSFCEPYHIEVTTP